MMTRRDLLFILGAGGAQQRDAASAGRFTNSGRVVTNDGRESCEILYRLTGEFIF